MLAIATQNNVRNNPVEELIEAEPDSTIGAHFAGLVKHEPHTMPQSIRTAPVANDAEIDDEDDDRDEGAPGTSPRGAPERWSKAAHMQIIGKRLVEARMLNGYSQTEAAQLLQYGTSAQLSQWEQCRRAVPLHMLIRFAGVMGVSVDWLVGLADDANRDVRAVRRNACIRAVRATIIGAVERVVDAFDADEAIVGLNVSMVRDLAAAADAVVAIYGDFAKVKSREAGPIGVGAKLARGVDQLESAALKAGIALRKHDDCDARQKERLAEVAANDA